MAKKSAKPKPADDDEEIDAEHEDATPEARPPLPVPAEVSAPAKASCLTFVFLILAVLITVCVSFFGGEGLMGSLAWYWYVTVALLVFIIPIVVYRAVALWMFDEVSRFPDIASAWRAGIVEMQSHGIAIRSAPLFLIVGTGNDRLRRDFMKAADSEFVVDGASGAGAPLHWYVNADGIFLYLNDTSWMNAAVSLYEVHAAAARSGHSLPGDSPAKSAARPIVQRLGTIMPDVRPSMVPQPVRRAELPPDDPAADPYPSKATPHGKVAEHVPAHGNLGAANYQGTLMPDQIAAPVTSSSASHGVPPIATTRPPGSQRVSIRLTSEQSGLQLQRLENVCGLLRKYRHPLCPANGILTLLPFEMLKAGPQDVAELQRAISADLSTIYRQLQLRCPVSAVVVGMEQERGFRELVRRIGHDGAVKQRFGQRFDIRSVATVDELRKFTSHLCGTFEDWVYTLFREEEALSHPGNTALYALLCKVRRTLKTRLGDILGNGFGCNPKENSLPVLFSGCYFAATGPKADRQAFVGGLLSKLYDEQEEIEWTDDALRDNERRRWLTVLGWLLCGTILLGTAIWSFWQNRSS
jgi:hypothetical protein